MLQDIMNWANITNIKFQMTFTNDKDKMEQFIKYSKFDFIISCSRPSCFYLKKTGRKFIKMNDTWDKGILYA